MRLIDADALTDSLDNLCNMVCQYSIVQRIVMCGACPLGGAFDAIDNAPTVDAVEVVRCKDCKYADEYAMCGFVEWYNSKDDYCSRGERREDEQQE